MKHALGLLLSIFFFFCVFTSPAMAEDLSAVEALSFNQMPAFQQEGSWPSIGEYAEEVGYDVARSWVAGEFPADVVKLGDILDGLHPEEFRLADLIDLDTVAISDIPLISEMPFANLLDSVPFSEEWPIEALPGVEEAFAAIGVKAQPAETLGQVVTSYAEVGGLPTGEIFGEMPVSTIPNIETTKISDFEGFQNQTISSIPGLADVALGDFPNPLDLLNVTAQQDIAFGKSEYSSDKPTPKPISGTVKEGFQVPCTGGCPHIELSGSGWQGDQWMTKDHRIPDGEGMLSSIPGMGEAGAYRLPFGEAFALQIRSTDEKTGAAEWGLAFRVCHRGLIDLGCTAYVLEVPLGITTHEKDTVLTGVKDLVGGASQPIAAPPGWEELRPETPPEVQAVVDRNTSRRRRGGGGSLCGDGPGGIEFQPLAEAYGYIEGNYNSVGSYVNLGGAERGYGIGRYQYMTYRSDVREIILAKPGGEAFLQTADEGETLSAADIDRFFTPEDQNELFKADQARNVEQALSEGFTGSRLIERIGQIHYGGSGAPIDGDWADDHGRLTLKTYGEELAENYEKANSEATSKCKAATPIKPLETKITGSVAAQEYGTARPNRGCLGNCHAGQDIDINEGEEFQAYLGGRVTRRECHEGGYYCFIDIYNEEMDVVLRIAEAEEILVEEGQTVEAGQVVSRGHAPTGVIHIEIRTDADAQGRGGYGTAGAVDPIEYLENVGVVVREGNSVIGAHDH
jgi:biotin carboxyl carrier protein